MPLALLKYVTESWGGSLRFRVRILNIIIEACSFSHFRTLFHPQMFRSTFYSIISSTTGGYCSVAFDQRLKNYIVQHNKQYNGKILLNSFHLNGHNLGFHSQT